MDKMNVFSDVSYSETTSSNWRKQFREVPTDIERKMAVQLEEIKKQVPLRPIRMKHILFSPSLQPKQSTADPSNPGSPKRASNRFPAALRGHPQLSIYWKN